MSAGQWPQTLPGGPLRDEMLSRDKTRPVLYALRRVSRTFQLHLQGETFLLQVVKARSGGKSCR